MKKCGLFTRRHGVIRSQLQNFFRKKHLPMYSLLWKVKTKDIQTVAITIGFPHSGSSLIGYLLTAHPNIIFCDEPMIHEIIPKANIDNIFYRIISHEKNLLREVKELNDKKLRWDKPRPAPRSYCYLRVPNQYQGLSKSLKVIGIKHSQDNVINHDKLEILKQQLAEREITMKYILIVRNPYDMIATRNRNLISAEYKKQTIKDVTEGRILFYVDLCRRNMEIIERNHPKDILFCKHEDMSENPERELTRLCDFLSVPISDDYLKDCTSQVIRKPNKSRFEHDWTPTQKQKVMSLIRKYDFFSGYDM